MAETSSRRLLRSMAIIASAQTLRIAIIILRTKIVAVLLGPSGIGFLSLLTSLRETVSVGAELGLSGSGVRELASNRDDPESLSRVRRVLFGALFLQGIVAMALVWLAREQVAVWLLGDSQHADEVGLVGVAVLFFLLEKSQSTLLQGLQRIADLGRVTVWGALFGTLGGLIPVALMGQDGLIWLVLLTAVANVLVALSYTRRLPPADTVRMTMADIWCAWLPLVKLGSVFMIGGLTMAATMLLIRARITQEMGVDTAGYFAAAWSVAMVYTGFMLQATRADYFPSLASVIADQNAASKLINSQMQLTLALGGPMLLVLIGCAPWVIWLLYASEFAPAVTILQWQTVGNIFRLGAAILAVALLAAAQSRVALMIELLSNALLLSLVWFGLSLFGLQITGIAFLVTLIVKFTTIALLVRHLHNFRWEPLSLYLFWLHTLLGAGLLVLSLNFPTTGGLVGLCLGAGTAFIGGHIVLTKIGSHGRLVSKVAWIYRKLGWPIRYVP